MVYGLIIPYTLSKGLKSEVKGSSAARCKTSAGGARWNMAPISIIVIAVIFKIK